MMGVKHTRHTEPIWNVARGLVVLTVLTLMGSTYLAAQGGQRPQGQGQGARGQGPGGRGAAPPAAEFVKPTEPGDFSGYWAIDGYKEVAGFGFDSAAACGAIKDPSGAPMTRCSHPWEAKGGAKFGIKDFLNKRGHAWMAFRDEMMSGMHLCLPNSLPTVMDHEIGAVRMLGPNRMEIQMTTDSFSEGLTRVIYMDGRKHPEPHFLFSMGHSIGWMEGEELVIESTNFPFDPDGIDDHLHIASSAAKKVTERWKKISANKIDITFTLEDKIFLKKPWTWTWHYIKAAQPPLSNFTCDPESAWWQIKVATPSPYDEDDDQK
jgi:hypothetical protein